MVFEYCSMRGVVLRKVVEQDIPIAFGVDTGDYASSVKRDRGFGHPTE